MYHNTTDSEGKELKRYRKKTAAQDKLVLEWFVDHPGLKATASMVHAGMIYAAWIPSITPITSIRRALTNLKDRCRLVKTDEQVKGPHNRPEYLYRQPVGQQELF